MRRLAAAVVLTAAAVPLLAQAPPAKKFTSDDGKFSAAFPVEPKVESQTLDTSAGKLVMNTVSAETKKAAFLVIWNDLPESTRDVPPKTLLDGGVKGLTNRGKVAEDKPTTFGPDKLPARRVVLDTKDGVRFVILMVVKDRRMYQAMAGGTKEFATSGQAETFLKSFELTK